MPSKLTTYFRTHYPLLIILLITLLLYIPSFSYDFVWDDNTFIKNWPVTQILTLETFTANLKGALPPNHTGVYRPIRSIAYQLTYALFQENTTLYHIYVFTLYAGVISFAYFILKELSAKQWPVIIATALFALHPIHIQSVAWITAGYDLHGALFFFISLFSFLKNRPLASYAFAFLAYFSHEMTLALPVLLSLVDFLQKKRVTIRKYIPYVVIAVVYLFVRIFLLQIWGRVGPIHSQPNTLTLLLVMSSVLIKYLQLFLLPIELSINHILPGGVQSLNYSENNAQVFQQISIDDPLFLMLLSTSISLVILFLYLFKKRNAFAIPIGWFLISLLPVMHIIPQNAFMHEYYAIIPSFAISLLGIEVAKNAKYKIVGAIFFTILIGLFSIKTLQRIPVWKSDITLWRSVLDNNPYSATAHLNMGVEYYFQNEKEAAQQSFNQALELNDALHPAYSLSAVTLAERGNLDQALNNATKAIELNPHDFVYYNNRGIIYASMEDLDKAEKDFQKAIELNPFYADAYSNMAALHLKRGETEQAIEQARNALALEPDHPQALLVLKKASE